VDDLKLEGLSKILTAYEDKRATAKVVFAYGERDKNGEPTEPSKLFFFTDLIISYFSIELFVGTAEGIY
jgi:hypothetical protein